MCDPTEEGHPYCAGRQVGTQSSRVGRGLCAACVVVLLEGRCCCPGAPGVAIGARLAPSPLGAKGRGWGRWRAGRSCLFAPCCRHCQTGLEETAVLLQLKAACQGLWVAVASCRKERRTVGLGFAGRRDATGTCAFEPGGASPGAISQSPQCSSGVATSRQADLTGPERGKLAAWQLWQPADWHALMPWQKHPQARKQLTC